MKILSQQFTVIDKLHVQGLLDWLDVYFTPLYPQSKRYALGLVELQDGSFDFTYQLAVPPEDVELALEMLMELDDQLADEFTDVVMFGEYRIIHGSTPVENFLLTKLQQATDMCHQIGIEVERLQYDMQHFKDIYAAMRDEVQSLKVYNHQLVTPMSVIQVLNNICEAIERDDIMEEFVPFTIQ